MAEPLRVLILEDSASDAELTLRDLRLLRQRRLETPFILVSGTMGEETAVGAMKEGATDYLLKDRLARLGPAVAQAVAQSKLHKARERAERDVRSSEQRFS